MPRPARGGELRFGCEALHLLPTLVRRTTACIAATPRVARAGRALSGHEDARRVASRLVELPVPLRRSVALLCDEIVVLLLQPVLHVLQPLLGRHLQHRKALYEVVHLVVYL